LEGEVSVASRGQEIVSVASQVNRFKCISCVPGFQPQAYELRPAVSKELHQLRWKIVVYKMSNNWKVLTQFYCTLLYIQYPLGSIEHEINWIQLNWYAHIQNCWMISTTQFLYHVTVWCLNPIKKSCRGRRQAHYVPNIAHFKLLLRSDENAVSGKSFNAESLGVLSI